MKSSIFLFTVFSFLAVLPAASAQNTASYTVVKGDTLYAISRKYGISIDDLCAANNMSKNNVIWVGQRLTIPGQETDTVISSAPSPASSSEKREYDIYTVQKGDTFYHIAMVNDISVEQLKSLNKLSADSRLLAGQKLKIPVSIVDTTAPELPDLPSNDPRTYSKKIGDSNLTWPVEHPTVTYTKGKVSGVQLSAMQGEEVKAIRAGTVMYTGSYRGYGQVVFVQSKAGYTYAYTGLGSINVKKGDYVVFGDSLGTAGTDGIKGTSQISFMVFNKSTPVDPATAPRG